MQVKKQQLEPDMEQQAGSKLGKEYIKAVYAVTLLLIKAMVYPVVMYGCETWTLTKEGCAVVSCSVVSNSLQTYEL